MSLPIETTDRIKTILKNESAELSEAITSLAVLLNEHEKARKKAQDRVTMADGKVSTLISMLKP